MNIHVKRTLVGLAVAGVVAGAIAIHDHLKWKRFDTVVEGELYRSGQLRLGQLGDAIDQLGLKTVVSFYEPTAEEERALCAAKGVDFILYPMPSDGCGEPAYFEEFLKLSKEGGKLPMLVHCHAGVARTGAAVALYRVRHQGWSVEEAIDELRSYEKNNGISDPLREHVVKLSGATSGSTDSVAAGPAPAATR